MPRVVLPSDLARFTGGASELEVAALNYRALVAELCERFPDLTVTQVRKFAIAIDGMIVQEPMLETFRPDSEVVLVAKIAGG
jgi:hypothetical protein